MKKILAIIIITLAIIFGIKLSQKSNESDNIESKKFEVCDEYGNRYKSEEKARLGGLSNAQFGATYCPEYLAEMKTGNELEFNPENKKCYQWVSDEKPIPSIRTITYTTFEDEVEGLVVSGIDDWIPAEKDSNMAIFRGYINGTILETVATIIGEGETYKEERFYKFMNNEISLGFIEEQAVLQDDGVYRYPSIENIKYIENYPQVDCDDLK